MLTNQQMAYLFIFKIKIFKKNFDIRVYPRRLRQLSLIHAIDISNNNCRQRSLI